MIHVEITSIYARRFIRDLEFHPEVLHFSDDNITIRFDCNPYFLKSQLMTTIMHHLLTHSDTTIKTHKCM